MKLFWRGCESWQLPYAAASDGLSARERMDLEQHAATCAECADALRNAGAVDTMLRTAYASFQERRALLAPGRVRLAVAPRPVRRSAWLRAPAFFARVAEVSVMFGVTLFALGGTIEAPQQAVPSPTHSVIQEYFRSQPPTDEIDYFRWLRLARPDSAAIVRDPAHLPVGGRFDVEPAEIIKASTSPR
jgi:hypothetical protein